MSDIDFLSLQDVLLAHEDQVSRYGGDPSVRDIGLLESAIAQPQATFGGAFLHDFPFAMAAAYMFHIVQNHPFVDGNKRSGAVAALLFLELNGIEINPPKGSIYNLTIAVANGLAGRYFETARQHTMTQELRLESTIQFERHQRGRKRVAPALEEPSVCGKLPRITRLIALAIHFDRLIRNGEIHDYTELAGLGHVTRARISTLLFITRKRAQQVWLSCCINRLPA